MNGIIEDDNSNSESDDLEQEGGEQLSDLQKERANMWSTMDDMPDFNNRQDDNDANIPRVVNSGDVVDMNAIDAKDNALLRNETDSLLLKEQTVDSGSDTVRAVQQLEQVLTDPTLGTVNSNPSVSREMSKILSNEALQISNVEKDSDGELSDEEYAVYKKVVIQTIDELVNGQNEMTSAKRLALEGRGREVKLAAKKFSHDESPTYLGLRIEEVIRNEVDSARPTN